MVGDQALGKQSRNRSLGSRSVLPPHMAHPPMLEWVEDR